jgi:DNA replication protein
MQIFSGFGEGLLHQVEVPETFFQELLPHIDHLGELKVVLYTFWWIDRADNPFRYLRQRDFLNDAAFIAGLAGPGQSPEAALDEALGQAVERGVLLSAQVDLAGVLESLYFLNTARGRAALQAIAAGEWRATGDEQFPVELIVDAPNIFRLYEQNIGVITPMIADMLRQAEAEYSPAWIAEALKIAVENNARNWRYVEAILKRWKEEGKVERKGRQDSEKALQRYAEWGNLGRRKK